MQHDREALAKDIDRCMLRDRHRLRRRLLGRERTDRRAREGGTANFDALVADIERSKAARERRAENLPRPTYPVELPISQRKDAIAAAIRDHQVVVVCGETGSGKTTQLPKICLELGRGVDGLIGHTQPRRLAARTLAARIASELGVESGRAVGHKIRFSDRTSDDTYVKLMTDGILLAETQTDRFLEQYDTLIVDEAHERSLNIDFLLGYLKRLLPKRPDLKIIVTSATIDPDRFSKHFDDAPVIEVSGRTYPVELRYRPPGVPAADAADGASDDADDDPIQAILGAIDELTSLPRGDVLVFLPGERAIRETADALRKRHLPHTEVLPLYARLSAGEQERIFRSHAERRIVLSTNVAETSLTVPGVRYVVDTGLARVSRYDVRRKVQRLPIERTSQASANQRSGRCGRTMPGVCIRLYSEEDFAARAPFTPPEIRRTNLAAVILQMEAFGLGDVEAFPFIEPPDGRAVLDGYATLFELGAIDEEHRLTRIGRQLARLPVDPRVGRMLLAARDLSCLSEVLVIGAALSVQDPRVRPHDEQEKADRAHERYRDDTSDFNGFLKIWKAYQREAQQLSTSKLRKWCEAEFLSFLRVREWQDVHDQLLQTMTAMGIRTNDAPASDAAIHRALLTGLLGSVARKADDRTYVGARNVRLNIFPGSSLVKKRPEWIVAAELVETDRLFARTAAKIDPAWVEPLAEHLVSRVYFEPHWEKNRGQVVCYERVSLHGLTVVPKRRVDFARIDAEAAREIFIRTGLVEGELRTHGPFLRHNQGVIEQIEALQERSRRRDLLVDEQAIYAFYDRHVPSDVHSSAAFEKWRKEIESREPRALFLRREEVLLSDPTGVTDESFPETLDVGGLRLPLRYRFEPGHPEDGVTVTLPLASIRDLSPGRFEWLVPGLLLEKVTAMIASLPKAIRKNFVPVPETAERCAEALTPSDAPLTEVLAAELEQMSRTQVPSSSFRRESYPPHLTMAFEVVDEAGRVVGASRDFDALASELGVRAKVTFERLDKSKFEQESITSWDFDDLPPSIDLTHGAFVLRGYPALAVEGSNVALRVFPTEVAAESAHRAGLRRLFALRLGEVAKEVRRHLSGIQAMTLWFALLGSANDLKDDLMAAAVDRVCIGDGAPPRTRAAFEQAVAGARGRLSLVAGEVCKRVEPILSAYQEIMRILPPAVPKDPYADVRRHVASLVYRGFVAATPWARLAHVPRYLKAAQLRVQRIRQAPQKDRERAALIDPLVRQYQERAAEHAELGRRDPELERYRWLLEEWRVSVFAQELKTAEPVSEKRLAEQWARVVVE